MPKKASENSCSSNRVVMRQSPGSERMQEVGLAIKEGAVAYLRRQIAAPHDVSRCVHGVLPTDVDRSDCAADADNLGVRGASVQAVGVEKSYRHMFLLIARGFPEIGSTGVR